MLKVNEKQFMQILPTVMNNGGAVYVRPTMPLVHLGLENDINEEYCLEHNIPIFKVERTGGAIVSNINDFDIIIVNKDLNKDVLPKLFYRLICICNNKNLNFKMDKNDLLIDGRKVASYAYRMLKNGLTYLAMHLSMSVDLELINNICKKEMLKVPGGLVDFGITDSEILTILNSSDFIKNMCNNCGGNK